MLKPKEHHFTSLVIRHFHRVNFHAGQELVLSLIREQFWIPHGKSAVKKELRNCIDCFKLVAKPVSQMMAFLSALRRFVSRRGYPSDIYSDNGTNFVGASAYLNDLFQLLHNSNVQDYSSRKNIQWHFIPPYAPNFGGVWEASVKLTKQHLLKPLKAAVLNFEELDTILCQIKACINSRPLYHLSSDPKDLQVVSSYEVEKDVLVSLAALLPQPLQSQTKWMQGQKDLTVGSLVLIKNPASFSTRWTPGRIVATHPGADVICRVVTIQISSGVMTRPVSQVAVLPPTTVDYIFSLPGGC
ncbi:integrase catalytic domain-containing protein [Trichonephila clavipes]|nr:integrase catalytic domain-containing protein [Trichonephila clavipes]